MGPFQRGSAGPRAFLCRSQQSLCLIRQRADARRPARLGIRQALGFSQAGLQWVFTAYALVFGGLLIFGGRVADLAGQRRTFLIGLAVFTAASAGCALAWSPAALVAGRVLQGAGAALLSPAALALLTTLSEPGPRRRRAVGWWTAVAAGGGASGWVLGGLITEYAGWRWVFAVNVPVGLVAVMIAPRVLPTDQRQTRTSGLDLGGALTATAGLALLVYGLTSAGERGLTRLSSWLPLLLAAVAFVIFVRHEGRTANPLVPLGLIRSPPVAGANLTALAITGSTTPAMYLSVLYVQDVLGVPAGRASLLFPAVNLAVIAGSLTGPRLLGRMGARLTAMAGFTGIAIGITMLITTACRRSSRGSTAVRIRADRRRPWDCISRLDPNRNRCRQPGLPRRRFGRTQLCCPGRHSHRRRTPGTACRGHRLVLLMTSYRIGFLGACAIAVGGAISSFLLPARMRRTEPAVAPHR